MDFNSFLKRNYRHILTIVFILFTSSLHAQDLDAHSPKPSPGGSHQQQIAEKKKEKQQKEIAKGNAEGKKLHEKIQTRNTRRMMRKSKQSSRRWNEKSKEPFFKRLFRKKH